MDQLQTAHEPACPGLDYDRDGSSLQKAICSLFRCHRGSNCKSLCSVASAVPSFWFCLKAVVVQSLLVSTWASIRNKRGPRYSLTVGPAQLAFGKKPRDLCCSNAEPGSLPEVSLPNPTPASRSCPCCPSLGQLSGSPDQPEDTRLPKPGSELQPLALLRVASLRRP